MEVFPSEIDINEKKYALVTPDGCILKTISAEEIDNRDLDVWISRCPCCGNIQGYYLTKDEAKEHSHVCYECRMWNVGRGYKGYSKEKTRFKLLVKGYRKYEDIIYPYLEMQE